MKLDRPVVNLSILGCVIGILWGYGLTLAFNMEYDIVSVVHPNLSDEFGMAGAVIIQTILSGLAGAASFGCMRVYFSERFSILEATLIHATVTIAVWMTTSNVCWWVGRSLKGNLVFLTISVLMYLMIWTIISVSYMMQIRQINELLEKRRRNQE